MNTEAKGILNQMNINLKEYEIKCILNQMNTEAKGILNQMNTEADKFYITSIFNIDD